MPVAMMLVVPVAMAMAISLTGDCNLNEDKNLDRRYSLS